MAKPLNEWFKSSRLAIYTKAAKDNHSSHYSNKQGEDVRCIQHTDVFSEYSDQFNDDYVGIEDIGNQTSIDHQYIRDPISPKVSVLLLFRWWSQW